MSVTLFFDKSQKDFQGFGCLIPRGFNIKALGILMNSFIFQGRAKKYNETWIFGGVHEDELLKLSDEEVLTKITEERFQILGHKENLLDYRIYRWKQALPYYDLQLEEVLRELQEMVPPSNIYLHGNYLGGLGLSKILERSENLAEEISKHHG